MSKNVKIILIIVAALVLAGLAAFMIFNMLSPQRATIYLFNDSYPAGTTISTSMFSSVQVDANMVSANVKIPIRQRFVTRDEFAKIIGSGDSLKIDVGKGMPLIDEKDNRHLDFLRLRCSLKHQAFGWINALAHLSTYREFYHKEAFAFAQYDMRSSVRHTGRRMINKLIPSFAKEEDNE